MILDADGDTVSRLVLSADDVELDSYDGPSLAHCDIKEKCCCLTTMLVLLVAEPSLSEV